MRPGGHWRSKQLQAIIGPPGRCFGAFVCGGVVASLRHRHDVRAGIAASMYLRSALPEAKLRIEVLCVVYLCYWKWSARAFLNALVTRLGELRAADSPRRAELYEAAWAEMLSEVKPAERTVVSDRCHRRVDLIDRKDKKEK